MSLCPALDLAFGVEHGVDCPKSVPKPALPVEVRLGTQGVETGTRGTLYFDDFESRRFSYIGTLTDPGVDDPQATNQAGWFARTYAYSASIPHAVTSVTPETGSPDTYEYDLNGNMTCRIENGVTYTHTYNAENRASSIAKRTGDCATGTIIESWSFAYDGDGTRVTTAHFTGTQGTPDSVTSYFMGGQYEVKDGATKKYYSIAGMMVAVNDGTGLQYLLTDHLGSTVAVVDHTTSTLTSQQRYLPFGATRAIPNSPILSTDFTFTGQRDLGDMGLMDYDARFYSQSLGRFLQPDTLIPNVSIPQTWNRYSYSINNPIKYTDPSGHFIETLFDVAMILVDVADIAKNGLNVSNGAALVLDVAAVIIPGVPAVAGLTIKAAKAANAVDNAMDAAKLVNKVDNVADTAKTIEKANIIDDLASGTSQSKTIANAMLNGDIGVNILGDNMFGKAYRYYGGKGSGNNVAAFAVEAQIYLRKNSNDILRDAVHEGTHALDFINGIKSTERRAYYFERSFQLFKGRFTEFDNLNKIVKHINDWY
jgi:RHS repeat-associated protein